MDSMRHYSIWLEKYGKSRDILLSNLKGYKAEIDLVRSSIADKHLVRPLAEGLVLETQSVWKERAFDFSELTNEELETLRALQAKVRIIPENMVQETIDAGHLVHTLLTVDD